MAARFEYVSDLKREWVPDSYDQRWSVDVKNTGDEVGVCILNLYERMKAPGSGQWSGFSLRNSQTKSLSPSQTVTFSGQVWIGPYTRQLMAKGEAGTLLNPSEPREFLCSCCFDTTGSYTSYETIEEYEAHFARDHSEYAPMLPLEGFSVKGIAWPDHFTKYREDYGRIVTWRAVCLLDQNDYEPDAGWWREYLPDTGTQRVDISQPLHFTMPVGWEGARRGSCGRIPNSTIIRLFFETDQGWTGFLDDSPWLIRIPNGAGITFEVSGSGAGSWQIEAPAEFSEFSIVDYGKVS